MATKKSAAKAKNGKEEIKASKAVKSADAKAGEERFVTSAQGINVIKKGGKKEQTVKKDMRKAGKRGGR